MNASRMLTLPAQTQWAIPAQRGTPGPLLKDNILILKLLWWLGKRCTNWDQCIYQSTALCTRAADISDYQRRVYWSLQNTRWGFTEEMLLTLVQPRSRIHSQQVGNAQSTSFKSHLKPGFLQRLLLIDRSFFTVSSRAKLLRLLFHKDTTSLLHSEVH